MLITVAVITASLMWRRIRSLAGRRSRTLRDSPAVDSPVTDSVQLQHGSPPRGKPAKE